MKTRKNHFTSLVLLAASLLVASCDCIHMYTYEATNDSSQEVEIIWKSPTETGTVTLEPGQTSALFVIEDGIEDCKTCPCESDVANDIENFLVYQNDTVLSNRNYYENQAWLFDDGFYRTVITDEEF